MPACVICSRRYTTVGPPGVCPWCWRENAMTPADGRAAAQLIALEEDMEGLEEAVALSQRFLVSGFAQLRRAAAGWKARVRLSDGRLRKLALAPSCAEGNKAPLYSALLTTFREVGDWSIDEADPQLAQEVSDSLRKPVICVTMSEWAQQLRRAVADQDIRTIVVWGPAACGKTTVCTPLAQANAMMLYDSRAAPPAGGGRRLIMHTGDVQPESLEADLFLRAK